MAKARRNSDPEPASGLDRRHVLGGLAIALGAPASGCTARLPRYRGDPSAPGSVARVERLAAYPEFMLRALIWSARLPAPIPVSTGVDLYRLSYWSTTGGKPMLVSGLMSVPQRAQPRGTVLWMHGTNTDRANSISRPSLQEGVTASAIFAGGGYLMLAPDLVGLGVSHAPQAYYYNPSTIAVTLDFLRAARQVAGDLGKTWRPELYLAGFSQGAQSAAVVHRELERRNDPDGRVKGTAAISGSYDLARVGFPFAIQGRSPGDTVYLGLVAVSYATYYRQPLESVLDPQMAPLVRRLLDGDHSGEIAARLPRNPRTIFSPSFLADFDAGRPDWFSAAMQENEACDWSPRAPFRAYYGDNDVDVPPADSKAFQASSKARGGNVALVNVGPYDHNATVYHAAPGIRAWFDDLSGPAGASATGPIAS